MSTQLKNGTMSRMPTISSSVPGAKVPGAVPVGPGTNVAFLEPLSSPSMPSAAFDRFLFVPVFASGGSSVSDKAIGDSLVPSVVLISGWISSVLSDDLRLPVAFEVVVVETCATVAFPAGFFDVEGAA